MKCNKGGKWKLRASKRRNASALQWFTSSRRHFSNCFRSGHFSLGNVQHLGRSYRFPSPKSWQILMTTLHCDTVLWTHTACASKMHVLQFPGTDDTIHIANWLTVYLVNDYVDLLSDSMSDLFMYLFCMKIAEKQLIWLSSLNGVKNSDRTLTALGFDWFTEHQDRLFKRCLWRQNQS